MNNLGTNLLQSELVVDDLKKTKNFYQVHWDPVKMGQTWFVQRLKD